MNELAHCFREDCNTPETARLKSMMYRSTQVIYKRDRQLIVELFECRDCYEKHAMRAWRGAPCSDEKLTDGY